MSVKNSRIIVMYDYLDDRQYSVLKRYCDKLGNRRMEFSEYKFLKDLDIMSASKEKIEEKINAWMEELKKMPVIFDESTLRSAADNIWDTIKSMKRVSAEYIVEKDEGSGKERGWIKLVFNKDLGKSNIWSIKEELMKIREIPYNIEIFEQGERKLKEIIIYAIRFNKEERNAVYVAPFIFYDVKRFLEEKGFTIDDTEISQPSTSHVVNIREEIIEKLRPYQREAFEKWIKNGYRGVIVIPTSGGKTWLGLAAIAKLKVAMKVFDRALLFSSF